MRAIYEQQEAVRRRFGNESALQNGLMSPWHVRLEAMRALAYQHRDEEIVAAALTEQDAPAVMDFALIVSLPASPALVEHRLAMRRAKPSMDMAYYYPRGNFLYAEKAIMTRCASSPMRLQPSVLTGFGLAGFQSAIPLLRKHAAITRLRTRAQALNDGDLKAAKSELGGPDFLERQWDGPSERGIEALVALSRLGAEIEPAIVRELYDQTTALLPAPELGGHGVHARGQLATVLFEAGSMDLEEALAVNAPLPDLLTTLLRRGDETAGSALIRLPRWRAPTPWFHFWPAVDFGMPPEYGQRGIPWGIHADAMYPLSRDAGVTPPPWWQWRTPWSRSDTSKALRGELALKELA